MSHPGITLAIRALRRATLAVALGGLLGGCAVDSGEAPATGGGEASLEPSGGTGGMDVAPGPFDVDTEAGGASAGYGGDGTDDIASAPGAGGSDGLEPGMEPESGGTGGAPSAAIDPIAAGGTGESWEPGETIDVVCSPIVNGLSTVTVNGASRVFDVQLPADTSTMALLFLWHGWMQQPGQFANEIVYDVPSGGWVPFDPNAFPMPLMIVTPHDTKLIPPVGLDWDIVDGDLDFPFFEAMLECIHAQFEIDEARIYSFGFSAGAVFTNLLSARYPHLFAATISESGAWFNDTAQWSDVSVPIMQWQWPAFDPADGGNVLLTHGGQGDYATVISLESANQKALPFLHAAGRTVIDCAHTFGHTLDPDLTQRMYYDYMWAHWLGGPPLSGLPPGFPTPESPVGSTRCTFHPAP